MSRRQPRVTHRGDEWPYRGTRERGERAAAERLRWRDPAWLAAQLRHAIEHPPLVALEAPLNRRSGADDFLTLHPRAREEFGDALIAAAVCEAVPSCCRWRYAQTLAAVRAWPEPTFTPAAVTLAGSPCDRCLTGWRRRLATRVDAARPWLAQAAHRDRTPRRSAGCAICDATAQLGLTASAAPHAVRTPVLAPAVRSALLAAWRLRKGRPQ